MRGWSLAQKWVINVLLAAYLSCLLGECAPLTRSTHKDDLGDIEWYIREVRKGEIIPVEGPHKHFEVAGQPVPIEVERSRLLLTFNLPDGRERVLMFTVQRLDERNFEVSCPKTNLEPNAGARLREDQRLNEAISEHVPVSVRANEWTTFFNDQLSGVFSSDWQLLWVLE